jgi:hypothetical protein
MPVFPLILRRRAKNALLTMRVLAGQELLEPFYSAGGFGSDVAAGVARVRK